MRRRFVLALAGLSALVLLAVGTVWVLPKQPPTAGTVPSYQPLIAAREARDDWQPEPTPHSVLANSAVPPTVQPESPPRLIAPVDRILIPEIDVDAQIVEMALTPAGALDVPNSPELVAWYGFTGKPGMGGNAVMSGHVDYRGYGPAVFWSLRKLVPGDGIEIELRDGNTIAYQVVSTQSYPVEGVPMAEVVAPTSEESLTLITCSGTFSGGHYSHRLVIRAVRVEG